MSQHASQRYRQVQVSTASKEDLLMLLLDGAVRFTEGALLEFDKEDADPGVRTDLLVRAQKIVLELMAALSPSIGLEIFDRLQDLYRFTFSRLFEGNVNADPELIGEGLAMLKEIRDMWKEAVDKAREEKRTGDGPARPPSNSSLSVSG